MQEQDIFSGLNDNQINAIKATKGSVRVIAGAGSDKTRVLTNRYAYLVNYIGIDPANILCMIFTNKAAAEMKSRIRNLVAIGAVNDFICTIHRLCVKILRREIHRLGYPQKFMILDNEDAKSLMGQVMVEQSISKQMTTINQLLTNVNMNRLPPVCKPWQKQPTEESTSPWHTCTTL
ncbi:MAG: UvrD-helicase domain-containing protein [Parabacteroides sp.]